MRTVLFLCSGNACRSRYAEFLFNRLAEEHNLPWRAASRGLMVDWMEEEEDESVTVSAETIELLSTPRFTIPSQFPHPQQVQLDDFSTADLLIAVSENEHRPVFQARYPDWEDDVEYWDIQDLILSAPELGLPQLTTMVKILVEDLTEIPVNAY